MKITAYTCFVYLTFTSIQAKCTDYYVSPNGSDLNSGIVSAPFRTITYAYSRVVAGDRILVQPGTYTDYRAGWALVLDKNGTALAPIILMSMQRGMAVIDASGQSDRPYGVAAVGNYHVIDGFKITGSRYTAVFVNGSNNKFVNNEVYNNGKVYDAGHTGNNGFYSDESTFGNYYGQNYLHDNGGAYGRYDQGLYLCGKNESVVNNIVIGWSGAGAGLQIAGYNTVSGLKVYNNIFAHNGTRGIVLWQAVNNIQIYNNIIVWNGTDGIGSTRASGGGVAISNNVIYGNVTNLNLSGFTHTLGSTIQKDPLFVSSTDYHLQSSSPAIGAGKPLTEVSQDFLGNPRSIDAGWDIGPYEYGSSSTVPPPPPPPPPPPVSVIQ